MGGTTSMISIDLIINILIFGGVSFIVYNLYQFIVLTMEIRDLEHQEIIKRLENIENKLNEL